MTPLAARWHELVGAADAAAPVGAELLRRWGEPHRRYHTLEHLAAVLDGVDELIASERDADPRAVSLAAWFHDAIYDPRRADNEEASASLARELLPRLGVAAETVETVADLILMTTTHEPVDASGRVLADADLAVLARPPATYDAYVAAVRAEYGFVPDDAWRRGRAAVLDGLLARAPLYSTAPMRPLEAQARANLERERANLRQ